MIEYSLSAEYARCLITFNEDDRNAQCFAGNGEQEAVRGAGQRHSPNTAYQNALTTIQIYSQCVCI